MTEIIVTISQKGKIWSLTPGQNNLEIAESEAIVTVEALERAFVYLDDEPLHAVPISRSQSIFVASVDFKNQIGFHRLRVRTSNSDQCFDFATVSAKATWDEVRKMAEVCAHHYLGYRRQFIYTSRTGQRRKVALPQIQYAWLRERVDEIEATAVDIARRPSREAHDRLATSVRGRGLSVPATVKLIHENPSLLEARQDGPIEVNGKRYWPAEVRVRMRDRVPAALEHEQIGKFLRLLVQGIDELVPMLEARERLHVKGWQDRLRSVAGKSIFAQPPGPARPMSTMPTALQLKDRRYKRLRELDHEYQSDIAPHDCWSKAIRANIKDAWEIYQTFVAHVMGNSFSLDYSSNARDLRSRDPSGASMSAVGMRLFFDVKPPKDVASSWRDESSRPADERPDVLIYRSADLARVMLDAKFRLDKDQRRAKPEDLFEMQGYLNSFSSHSGGIVFPGSEPRANYVSGGKSAVAEIPLRARFFDALGGADNVHSYIREALLPLWCRHAPS